MSLLTVFNHRYEDRFYDYLTLNLLLPDFTICKKEITCKENLSRSTVINFPTKFAFYIDEDMWLLEIQIFGFGFGIARQWDY